MNPDEGSQSSETELKTKDRLRIDSSAEFDEQHRVKVSGATDILKSSISSDPNTTKNFGEDKVLTQSATHVKNPEAALAAAHALKPKAIVMTWSAAQIRDALAKAKPTETAEASAKAKSKDRVEASDEQKQKVEIDDNGFKIPQGTAHHSQKKLEAAECCKIVDRVLKRELDSSEYLVNIVKVRLTVLAIKSGDVIFST